MFQIRKSLLGTEVEGVGGVGQMVLLVSTLWKRLVLKTRMMPIYLETTRTTYLLTWCPIRVHKIDTLWLHEYPAVDIKFTDGPKKKDLLELPPALSAPSVFLHSSSVDHRCCMPSVLPASRLQIHVIV